MMQEKEYLAFISYQRKDEEWADRLRNKLEHYRLPSSVRKQNASLPKEIRPIFRDALELASGVLAKEIETALRQSKYLIVICSPNSAKSPWVNKEIQTFIDLGREDRIIPFIIDGMPFTDNEETECFPFALRSLKGEKELLGININELSRDAACIKVVARMFGLRFDTLWQRYEREQKRRRNAILGIVMLIGIIGIGLFLYYRMLNNTIFEKNQALQETISSRNNALQQLRQDSVIMAQHLERIQSDSVLLSIQKDSIQKTNDLLEVVNSNLVITNANLKEANYIILQERNSMLTAQSRAVAEKAIDLISEGDYFTARIIASEVLPDGSSATQRPYIPVAEAAFRKANQFDSGILGQHSYSPLSVCFSPNNKYVISGSIGGDIKIWDIEKDVISKTLIGHNNTVSSVSFSPDGNRIISAAWDGKIKIWDVSSGMIIKEWDGTDKEHTLHHAYYSPDGGLIVSTSNDSIIKIWNAQNGILQKQIVESSYVIGSARFSSDGNYLLSTSGDKTIKVWDVKSGELYKELPEQDYYVNSLNWSPNGRHIVSSTDDGKIQIWDFETGKLENVLVGHTNSVNSARYSNDGRYIVSASYDETIKIWDSNTGSLIKTLKGHNGPVYDAVFDNSDLFIASGAGDNAVRIWGLKDNNEYCYTTFDREELGMALFYNNSVIILSNNGFIRKWDYFTNETIFLNNQSNSKRDYPRIAINKEKTVLAKSSWDGSITFLKPDNGEFLFSLFPQYVVYSIDFSPINSHIAIGGEKGIEIWDLKTKKVFKRLNGHEKSVTCVSFSPNGNYLASASFDEKVYLWDLKRGLIKYSLDGHNGGSRAVFFSNNSQYLASAGYDGRTIIWDMMNGKQVSVLEGHKSIVWSAIFSHNDKQIVTASSDSTIIVWDVKSGIRLLTLSGHSQRVNYACFSPDDHFIISTSDDGTMRVWEFPPLQELIDKTRKRFKNRPLTLEERRKYYFE